MRNIGIDQLLYINNQTKIMFPQEQVALPQLSNAKSADCLKLDLNYKISKKSELKLLNAKLRKLKNRCRALREQSKTDRQFLSNLLTATSQLQSKTNDGIQACKQVCTEMLDNHAEMRQQKAKSSLAQIANHALDLALESNCDRDKTTDVQKQEQLIDQKLQIIALIQNYQDKINIHSIPTDRSITASVKSQTNKEDRQFLEEEESKNTMSGNTCENSAAGETQIKRANTISFSPSKSKIYRKASLFLTQRKKEKIKIRSENLFTKYVYTIVCTILLTIIFFKLIIF